MKKLYGIIIGVAFVCYSSHAQIIYTDVNPDHNGTYKLDLNNDSINDFILKSYHTNSWCCRPCGNEVYARVSPLNNNAIASKDSYPLMLDTLSIIDSFSTWSSASD